MQYGTLISFVHVKARWPVLPWLTETWGQRSFPVPAKVGSNEHI